MIKEWFLIIILLLQLLSCNNHHLEDNNEFLEKCFFKNPIAIGQDPYVVRHNDVYYYIESKNNAIWIYRSQYLTKPKMNGVKVWESTPGTWNQTHIWAPELHFINGRWYIYYAAGRSGPPFIHQRCGVLQSTTDDPQGSYVDMGQLFTGEIVQGDSVNIWCIDLTIGKINDQLYAVWSGWEENRDTDKTSQHLYIAKMCNPWTICGKRVKISSPTESWELGTELSLNEGPQFLYHENDVFIVYSTNESWLPSYKLGLLKLVGDPLNPSDWIKIGPVFEGNEKVYGVGHASFTVSPDGSENWIVYHTKASKRPGWERLVHTQPFFWNSDGLPFFGIAKSSEDTLKVPSGQPCNIDVDIVDD